MKAAYYHGQGKFTIDPCTPTTPQEGEVRLRVHYCGICGTDIHISHGVMDHRISPPQVIGHEMSGVIEEIGEGVTGFSVGEPVAVRPVDARKEAPSDKGVSHICRGVNFIGIDSPGALQAQWTVPAFTLHKLPEGMDMKLAAMVEPVAVACHDVRRANVRAGETVVVIGGGPIGQLIGLVARARGAKVLLTEVSAPRLQKARELGFLVVDGKTEDANEVVMRETNEAGADVVFEVSGSAHGARLMTQLACLQGRVVVVAIYPRTQLQEISLFEVLWKELSLLGARLYTADDFEAAIALIASGTQPIESLLTKVVPLECVADVIRELETNPESMKILLDCQS
eukprot:NODE_2928_length_1062_cov_22.343316_g2794_i0.p1 GENE.NODE_2928_length_1062_cov_22.343316_g2794_i0~~NODE_2928_length_1062_cov_22.343316_g2794_i0.p1  ORF type:complete len:341 (+),score=80.40 NODE_2928_length_1062_cov_22.343316_g2794_i0:20-1042(+)